MKGWMKTISFFVFAVLISFSVSAQICANNIQINNPQGVAIDSNGNKYISDTNNNRIIKIDSSGVVSVFAGDIAGASGYTDATGTAARFNRPYKIMAGGDTIIGGGPPYSYLYVADTDNNAIRKIVLSTGAVTTIGGGNGAGLLDGVMSASKFDHPKGLHVNSLGVVYVADTGNNRIRRINQAGGSNAVTTVAGGGTTGISCVSPNNCASSSSPPQCSAMQFNAPEDVFVYTTGSLIDNFYIADTGNHAIEMITNFNPAVPLNCNVQLIAGSGTAGYNQGGTSANLVQFSSPSAIESIDYSSTGPVLDTSNYHMFIVDRGNHLIRQLTTAGGYAVAYPYAGISSSAGSTNGPTTGLNGLPPLSTAKFSSPSDIVIGASNFFPYTSPYTFYVADSSNNAVRSLTGASNTWVWNTNTLSGGVCPGGQGSTICTSPNDVIMRLSSATNAHGEVYNGAGSYTTEICYSSLFGASYSGANPQQCSASNANRVLRLSGSTNAHAETPDIASPTYTTDVCYGDLNCVSSTSACVSPAVEVVSLSSATNAHLETASSTNYATHICCSRTTVPVGPSITNARWTHYDGTPIGINDIICVNEYVRAKADASGLTNNLIVDSAESDWVVNSITGLPTPNGLDDIIGIDLDTGSSSSLDYPFQLTPALLSIGAGGEAPGNPDEEIYFVAKSQIGPYTSAPAYSLSYVLHVSSDPTVCNTQPPTVSVIAPIHQGVYFIDTQLNFQGICSSPIGPATLQWEIVQDGVATPYTNSNAAFSLYFGTAPSGSTQYGHAGQARVRLTCTDILGKSSSTEKQILIVASPYSFAYINAPAYNTMAYNPPPASGTYIPAQVGFSTTDSFILTADSSTCSVTCLYGICPAKTQNAPAGCSGQILINNAPGWKNLVTTNPLWEFWDSNWNSNSPGSISYAGLESGVMVFDDMSTQINDKHMKVTITNPNDATVTATFTRDFTLGRCLNNGQTFVNVAGANVALQSTTGANAINGACKGVDGVIGNGDDCCPSSYQCQTNAGLTSCILPSGSIITQCSEYTSATACNNNLNNINPLTGTGVQPSLCSAVSCHWDTTSNICGIQIISLPQTATNGCTTTGPSGTLCTTSDCSYTTQVSACSGGTKSISYNPLSATSANTCVNPPTTQTCSLPSVTVPCGALNFELPIFNYIHALITSFIILVVYIYRRFPERK